MKMISALLFAALLTGIGCGYGSTANTPATAGAMPAIAQLAPNSAPAGSAGLTIDGERLQLFDDRGGELEQHGPDDHLRDCQPADGGRTQFRPGYGSERARHGDQPRDEWRDLRWRHARRDLQQHDLYHPLDFEAVITRPKPLGLPQGRNVPGPA